MLEARLEQASLLKKLLDSIKELVSDANFECQEDGIRLQAMDNSHVALISVELMAPGFKKYRCDRPMPLGVNLNSLSKVLKCAKDDDQVTLKAGDNNDVLNLLYESPSTDRIAEYEMKLMDIDVDQLGIPDTAYDASIVMSSAEFARIVRDLSNLGESVKIEVSKEGIRFSSEGDTANGNVLLKHSEDAAKKYTGSGGAKGEGSSKGKGKEKEEKPKVKKEKNDDDDEDATMEDPTQVEDDEIIEVKAGSDAEEEEEEEKKKSDDEKEASGEEEEEEEEDDDDSSAKKRKRKANGDAKGKKSKKAKKEKDDKKKEEEEVVQGVIIRMSQTVNLTFSLKYLVNITKSTSLSKNVQLQLSNEIPLLVAYDFGPGTISYYLAPKIGDD